MEVRFEKGKIGETKPDILIPNAALITKYGETGVYILENGRTEYRIVTVIASDGNMSTITGLKAGQKIITKGKENILDGEMLE